MITVFISHKKISYYTCISLLSLICLISSADKSYAKMETLFANYKYVMGDNDTKNDAKRICFIEAKRRLLEKAGVFIESSSEVKNFQLTRDEIKTYTAAILKTEIVNEEIKYEGQNMVIYMNIKADFDTDAMFSKLKEIKENKEASSKIVEQQKQIAAIEDKIKKMQSELQTNNLDKSIALRKERQESFEQLSELEKIKFDINKKTSLAVENIELGMTPNEVERIAGKPRSIGVNINALREDNYGKVWVIYESEVVACIVRSESYSRFNWCSNYRSKIKAIIK